MVERRLPGNKETIEKAGIAPEEIAGMGIDGQSWSAIAIDKEGNVLTKHSDLDGYQSTDICEELTKKIGEDKIFEVCGNLFSHPIQRKDLWYQRKSSGSLCKDG